MNTTILNARGRSAATGSSLSASRVSLKFMGSRQRWVWRRKDSPSDSKGSNETDLVPEFRPAWPGIETSDRMTCPTTIDPFDVRREGYHEPGRPIALLACHEFLACQRCCRTHVGSPRRMSPEWSGAHPLSPYPPRPLEARVQNLSCLRPLAKH
jgi:hypothetical protein